MTTLQPADRVEVHVLVDNVTDSLSSVPDFVETEFAGLTRRRGGSWVLGGSCLCCAAHGLACLVTVWKGAERRTMLFDSGPEDRTFEQNVSRLGVELGAVEAIVLSHGHWDHGGAMLRALQLIRDRNGGAEVLYYAHPDMFRTRATMFANDQMRPMEDVPSVNALTAHGARVVNTREAQVILGGLAYVSGEIPRVTSFERGLKGQHRRTLDDTGWELDELIMDERFVAVHVAGKGVVVLTACSHAGVINVLAHARTHLLRRRAAVRGGRRAAPHWLEREDHSRDHRRPARSRARHDRAGALHRLACRERARRGVRREQARAARGR